MMHLAPSLHLPVKPIDRLQQNIGSPTVTQRKACWFGTGWYVDSFSRLAGCMTYNMHVGEDAGPEECIAWHIAAPSLASSELHWPAAAALSSASSPQHSALMMPAIMHYAQLGSPSHIVAMAEY